MLSKRLVPSLLLALGLAACSGSSTGTSSSVSSITSTTSTGTSGATTSLAVGQVVQVTFDANGAAATIVAGRGGFGHHGGMMAFGPLGGDGPEGMAHGMGSDTVVVDYTKFGSLHGPVEAVDTTANTITVLGMVVTVDASTRYLGVTALTDVQVGAQVAIRVTIDDSGALTASAVRVNVPTLGGAITAVASDGSSITVLGRTVTITASTTITVVVPPTDTDGGHHGGTGMGMGGGGMGMHGG